MATKKVSSATAKSSLETTDSILLTTSNGLGRITKTNMDNYVKGAVGFANGATAAPADVNNITESGFYWTAQSTQNLPASGSYGYLLHVTRNATAGHMMQMFYCYSTGQTWMRFMVSGEWKDWKLTNG